MGAGFVRRFCFDLLWSGITLNSLAIFCLELTIFLPLGVAERPERLLTRPRLNSYRGAE
jgi:hypothetical protein